MFWRRLLLLPSGTKDSKNPKRVLEILLCWYRGNTFLWNVSKNWLLYMASYPRKFLFSTYAYLSFSIYLNATYLINQTTACSRVLAIYSLHIMEARLIQSVTSHLISLLLILRVSPLTIGLPSGLFFLRFPHKNHVLIFLFFPHTWHVPHLSHPPPNYHLNNI